MPSRAKHDKHDFVTRTGSRATVPSKRGHFRGLAPNIQENLTGSEQKENLSRRQRQLEAELRKLKALSRNRMAREDRIVWKALRHQLVSELEGIRKAHIKEKRARGDKGKYAYLRHFKSAARKVLDGDTFKKIEAVAREDASREDPIRVEEAT